MKRLITITLALLLVLAYPDPGEAQEAEEMPVTFYGSIGATAGLDDEAAINSASASLRFGVKTELNKEGTWRLITEYNSINRPLKKNETNGDYVKSIAIGAERLYWLKAKSGFLSNTAAVLRGAFDVEVNRTENDNNLGLGFGLLKKMSVDDLGRSHFSLQLSLDMLMRDNEKDDLSLFATLNFTPFQ